MISFIKLNLETKSQPEVRVMLIKAGWKPEQISYGMSRAVREFEREKLERERKMKKGRGKGKPAQASIAFPSFPNLPQKPQTKRRILFFRKPKIK